jgi:hypothetical protein
MVSPMGDVRDRVQDGMTALEKLVAGIPGYRGYRERGNRRDADRLWREHLLGLLDDVRRRLSHLQARLSAEGQFKPVTDLNRVSRRLMRIRDRIEHAGYAYGAFFDPIEIEGEALDQLYEYDLSLKEYLGKVDEAAATMVGATVEQRPEAITALSDALDEIDRMVHQRNEAVAELAP